MYTVTERYSAKELFKRLTELKNAKKSSPRVKKEPNLRNKFVTDWYNQSDIGEAIRLPKEYLDHKLNDKDISPQHRTKKLITNDLLRKGDEGKEKPLYKKVEIFIEDVPYRKNKKIRCDKDGKPIIKKHALFLMKIG